MLVQQLFMIIHGYVSRERDVLKATNLWILDDFGVPSGKRLHSYGKSPFFMGKSTINGDFP